MSIHNENGVNREEKLPLKATSASMVEHHYSNYGSSQNDENNNNNDDDTELSITLQQHKVEENSLDGINNLSVKSCIIQDNEVGHGSEPTASSHRLSLFDSLSMISTRVWQHVGQIGILGSVSIAVNFLTGPAMLEIPAVYQKSGIIPTTLNILLMGTLSALGSLHMARVISQVPGNANFHRQVEYSQAFRETFLNNRMSSAPASSRSASSSSSSLSSKYWFHGTQIIFFACVLCLNISSLVDSAQVFDTILANVWGFTSAIHVSTPSTIGTTTAISTAAIPRPTFISWGYEHCTEESLLAGECIPFENDVDHQDGFVITAGYLLNVLCFLPLSLMNLQENAAWQVIEFWVLLITSCIFGVQFCQNGLVWDNERISWWGESWDGLFGVILFNFALVISIASWLYEKEPYVDTRQVIIGSTGIAAVLYIVLGILGAMSIPHVSENMLETFMSGVLGVGMQWTSSIFALFIVGLGIPLLCVLCRLNLTGSGMAHSTANWYAVYLPFGLSWLAYRGDLVTRVLSWGGSIFTSLIAFIFPLLAALQMVQSQTIDPKTISVYGKWWDLHQSEARERRALYGLLGISIVSIFAAIIGNIIQ